VWSLSDVRAALSDRLGETSIEFWSDEDRIRYLNEAQRFVAAVTRGVPSQVSGSVETSSPTLTLPDKLVNAAAAMGYVDGGRALSVVDIETANMLSPNWRTLVGSPLWIILDVSGDTARVSPVPTSATTVYLSVSVLPDDLASDSDELFNGVDAMEKYQGVVLNIAAALALLKERYDGDAERFYQFAMQEMGALGVKPDDIPTFQQVRETSNG